MNDRLKDILSHLNPEVDQETLLRYLQGHLTPEKAHDLEAQLLDSDFESDALEGLQGVANKGALPGIVEALNRDLQKKTARRKSKQLKPLRVEPWLLITIVTVLILVIVGFVVLWKKQHGG
ncbi:MAG: hypothetical protein EOO08_03760 [Chitinophagaceae bacterium]|nr:MAG: hypothetical protein EOO08_03760 [Chitinophagaceae bacterium]